MIFQRIPPLFIFILLPNLFASVNSQICQNNGNYTANSTYSANLQTALSSVSTNINNNGFYNVSVGQNPDRANVIALCRGDIQLNTCRECVQTASSDLRQSCPYQKQAVHWPEFCMLRYSNESMLGKLEMFPSFYMWNINNATSPNLFATDLRTLLDKLRGRAADGGSLRKVAAGSVTGPDFKSIYGMVQCTPDLSPDDCSICLEQAAAAIPIRIRCDGKTGCRVNMPSCTLRFEINGFYNGSRLQELSPPPPPATASVPNRPPILSPPGKGDGNKTLTVIIIVTSVVASVILAIFLFIFLRKRIMKKAIKNHESDGEGDISTPESLEYAFSTIKVATNDFSDNNKLGEGGFGVVYKGKLLNGQEIAVKKLSKNSGQGNLEFRNEVLLLTKLQHRNLVRLLGFSIEGMEKLLVYEYVHNASLDLFIFDPIKHTYLDWNIRYTIILGIARGILYLHEDSRLRIIHRDLKASNILLDRDMNPKIADFGMARLFEPDETQGNTSRIVGTYGYIAPEYAMHGQFSIKSDVFSFGVLILEIISGQRNNCFRNGENVEGLLNFAWKNWHKGTSSNMVDPFLRSNSSSMCDIMRCIHIGLLCVQENAIERPTMASVILMLSSFSLTLEVPSEPTFYIESEVSVNLQEHNSRELSKRNSKIPPQSSHSSLNDASISDLYPR